MCIRDRHKFDFTGLAELTEQLCESKVPVYLTIDLDCLDPSCFPGTGTPDVYKRQVIPWMPQAHSHSSVNSTDETV